jgi:type IV pilus assembly protein PilA
LLKTIKQRLGRDDEQGFTLIELMVVVLIIAILLAIAIPTFLSARNSANSRSAQSDLRNATTAEQSYFTNNQVFGDQTVMPGIESSLHWVAGTVAATTTVPNTISDLVGTVPTGTGQTNAVVVLQAQGKDNKCYNVILSNDSANSYTGYQVQNGVCAAPALPAALATPTAGSASATGAVAGTWYTGW